MTSSRPARARRRARLAGTAGAAGVALLALAAATVLPPAGATAAAATARTAAARPGAHPAAVGGPRDRALLRAAARASALAGPAEAAGAAAHRLPTTGNVAVMLELDRAPAARTWLAARHLGRAAAASATRDAESAIGRLQASVRARLASGGSGAHVLFAVHAAYDGIAVRVDARHLGGLAAIPGVKAVHRLTPKTLANTSTVPLIGGPAAWSSYGTTGTGVKVGVIDTGIDYTHADFGGPGTKDAYQQALAHDTDPVDPSLLDPAKVAGGVDLVGDAYDAGSTDPAAYTPQPDPNYLDCEGHGTHVAGTAAGYGVLADGSSAKGTDYASLAGLTPADYRSTFKVGPGVAPGAQLYAIRVFGCSGSTDVVSEALDWALDPNGDGDLSDRLDVVNLSLGSDYGTDDDPDAVAANLATKAGLDVVAAAGNGGDLFDVGGSPGNAQGAIGVAASDDGTTVADGLQESAPTTRTFPEEESSAFDWTTLPNGQSGTLYFLQDAGNQEGCNPYDPTDTTGAAGHIVVVHWPTGPFACGSKTRANMAEAAGAAGVLIWYAGDTFDFSILGNSSVPEALVLNAGGQALSDDNDASGPVAVRIGDPSLKNSESVVRPQDADKVASFSSRGDRDAHNLKPDLTAPGVTVFSAGMGTGDDGVSESGTSMATPHVTGSVALVESAHPGWMPEQVKADLMNTAGEDLYTGDDHTGDVYPPNRVGAGRIELDPALSNAVLAYAHTDASDQGAVSVSFGPLAVTAPLTLTKTVEVENTGDTIATYDVAYDPIDQMQGVDYTTSMSSIAVRPGGSATFDVTLSIPDPTALDKPADATLEQQQDGLPRQWVADASGRVVLTPSGAYAGPALRVPVYAAPRPAALAHTPSTVTLPSTGVSTTTVPLSGTAVRTSDVTPLVAGFELQGKSPRQPSCSATVVTGCVAFPSDRAGDLRDVGVASDAAYLASTGGDELSDGMTYFAIGTYGPWHTPASYSEYDVVFWDGPDPATASPTAVLFNTRLAGTDVFVSELYDMASEQITDVEFLDALPGDTDTDAFDSDTLVLPVWTAAIPGVSAASSRVDYSVEASTTESGLTDTVGEDSGRFLSFDVLHPAYTVSNGTSGDLFYTDQPGTTLLLRQDAAELAADRPLGVLFLHMHDITGLRAQVTRVKRTTTTKVTLSRSAAGYSAPVTATIRVASTLPGITPTGTVQLLVDGAVRRTATLRSGKATVALPVLHPHGYVVQARYRGDATSVGSTSPATALSVFREYVTVTTWATHRSTAYGSTDRLVAVVAPRYSAKAVPTGEVAFYLNGVHFGTSSLVNGRATWDEHRAHRGRNVLTAVFLGSHDARPAHAENTFRVS